MGNQSFEGILHDMYERDRDFVLRILQHNLVNFDISARNSFGTTLLHMMVERDDLAGVIQLLQHIESGVYSGSQRSAIINAQDHEGNTALHIATANQRQDIAHVMYKSGARTDIANNNDELVKLSDEKSSSLSDVIHRITGSFRQRPRSRQASEVFSDTSPNSVMSIHGSFISAPRATHSRGFDSQEFIHFLKNKTRQSTMVTSPQMQVSTEYPAASLANIAPSMEMVPTMRMLPTMSDSIDTDGFINRLQSMAANTRRTNPSDTDQFINRLRSMTAGGNCEQDVPTKTDGTAQLMGGGDNMSPRSDNSISTASLIAYLENNLRGPYGTQDGGSKEASKVHDETLERIKSVGYSEEDARILKAALYRVVKTEYPNETGLERAKKMLESATRDTLKDINVKEYRQQMQPRQNEQPLKPAAKPKAKKESTPGPDETKPNKVGKKKTSRTNK